MEAAAIMAIALANGGVSAFSLFKPLYCVVLFFFGCLESQGKEKRNKLSMLV